MTNLIKCGTYMKGDMLLIECENSNVYSGLFISQSERRISLYGVIEYPSRSYIESRITFDINEIVSIKRVLKNIPESVTITNDDVDHDFFKWMNLSSETSYKVLTLTDSVYFDAIDHLRNSTLISIDSRGAECGRQNKMSILVLGTLVQTYVFDLQKINFFVFSTGLREILESEYIIKMCHDSRKLADCLLHIYNVNLDNVFDFQVADMIVQKQRDQELDIKPRSFADIVNVYMNYPKGLFSEKGIKIEEWFERPIQQRLRDCVAINVSFMFDLYHRLKRIMNHDLYIKFDNILHQTS